MLNLDASRFRALPALGLLAAVLLVPAEARAETLGCDVEPIVIANTGGGGIWAYDLAAQTVIWEYDLSPDPSAFDVGQDEQGRIFLVESGGGLHRLVGSSGTYAGTAATPPGSGATTQVAAGLTRPVGSAATGTNTSMLGFDKYGYGYVFGVDENDVGIELMRFDPDATVADPTTDPIALEVVAADLQTAGLPAGGPSGDFFIAGSVGYVAWNDESGDESGLTLVAIALTDTGSEYEYAGSAYVVGPMSAPDDGTLNGYGMAATGGLVFLDGLNGAGDPALYEAQLVGGNLSAFAGTAIDATDTNTIFGLTGNGEAVFDDCFSFARSGQSEHPMQLACSPDPVSVGGTVTCQITGGDPSIDILWEASYGTVFVRQGVTLDAEGRATFTFVAPAASRGLPIMVGLVEWNRTATVNVIGTAVPTRIAAGGGSGSVPFAPAAALLVLAAAAAIRLRRVAVIG